VPGAGHGRDAFFELGDELAAVGQPAPVQRLPDPLQEPVSVTGVRRADVAGPVEHRAPTE
jgi:hypothetical protein